MALERSTRKSNQMYFENIPDEVAITIVNGITDIESLFNLHRSCREFSNFVFQKSGTISVEIPSNHIPSIVGVDGDTPVSWPSGLLSFLSRFIRVEFVIVRFHRTNIPYPVRQIGQPLCRWKADSLGFIMLYSADYVASSLEDATEICNMAEENDFPREHDNRLTAILTDCRLRVRYIRELLAHLPSLKGVSAVDFQNQGLVVVDEDGVDFLKQEQINLYELCMAHLMEGVDEDSDDDGEGLDEDGEGSDEDEYSRKTVWIAHEVKMPFSGFLLRRVTLLVYRLKKEDDIGSGDVFEENGFSEVVIRMMMEDKVEDEDSALAIKYFFLLS